MGDNAKRSWPGPPAARLNMLALRILDEALEQAHHGPVRRNAGHRLALAWLATQRAGLDWHYKAFWEAMVNEHGGGIRDGGKYVRTTHMRTFLNYWKRSLKVER